MPHKLVGLVLVALTLITADAAHSAPPLARPPELRITVLFNNVPLRPGLTTGWGFSCLIEGTDKAILFDTGGDGAVLLANMGRMGLGPKAVGAIVLSHIHADHTGGLDELLAEHADLDIWLPAGFPAAFQRAVANSGARVKPVHQGGQLFGNAWSTGELGDGVVEQALILDTLKGLVVITGCAHSGIDRIAETAVRLTGKRIHLLMGGFHLGARDRRGSRHHRPAQVAGGRKGRTQPLHWGCRRRPVPPGLGHGFRGGRSGGGDRGAETVRLEILSAEHRAGPAAGSTGQSAPPPKLA